MALAKTLEWVDGEIAGVSILGAYSARQFGQHKSKALG